MLQPMGLRTGASTSGSPRYEHPTTQSNSTGNQAGRRVSQAASARPPGGKDGRVGERAAQSVQPAGLGDGVVVQEGDEPAGRGGDTAVASAGQAAGPGAFHDDHAAESSERALARSAAL